jgi:aminoglycoside phosphotransferase family enzyme/predicted kinase
MVDGTSGRQPSASAQSQLVESLTDPALYGEGCRAVRVIQTHISYVLLTGRFAYKIKKDVNLGFLDFTTLAARRFYCERELELNRRLAPAIYLEVVAVTGSAGRPRIGGDGPALEYAVKMLEFPQDSLLTRLLERGALTAAQIEELADAVAAFHSSAATAGVTARFGSAAEILELAIENFTEIEPLLEQPADRREVAALRQWTEREHRLRTELFAARQRGGCVRECHGDLHLGNVACVEGRITIFDCIEFNDDMRWSDVMADVGFVVMDLADRRRPDFAMRFLNAYLERTGDYDGVQVLRFYVVYRAMVRAKVAGMTAHQMADPAIRSAKTSECREYLSLATRCSEPAIRGIVITHGLTGSGKTTQSQGLVDLLGAIRVRTDVERKRLHGLASEDRSGSSLSGGLYTSAETDRTYRRVSDLARCVARGGYPVVIDGTFLQRRHREQFRALATELCVPCVIVDFVAPVETLRTRVQQRYDAGIDASEADSRVLEHQQRTADPLSSDEQAVTITWDAESSLERARRKESWQPVLDRLTLGQARSKDGRADGNQDVT